MKALCSAKDDRIFYSNVIFESKRKTNASIK